MKSVGTVSVVGLGKLGTPFLVSLASRGFRAIGVDVNLVNVAQINRGISPIFEPRVPEFLKKYKRLISATTDINKAINNSQLTFIIVPTPSQKNGEFTNKFIISSLQKIGEALKSKSTYHLVTIVSTIMPGSMDQELRPELEKAARKKIGADLGFCYSPTFIALGDVIRNLLEPDFLLIGQSDKKAGDILSGFYTDFCTNRPPIRRMNFINAEISKLALNTFITTKISYANMLSEICEKLPGADVDVVTQAIGSDSRVGHKYLKGAVCYGGPCFPRDNRALTSIGKKINVKLDIAQATDAINFRQTEKIISLLSPYLTRIDTIGIVGLAYKPDTDVIEESQGLKLVKYLRRFRKKILVYDPVFTKQKLRFADSVKVARNLGTLLKYVDALILTSAEPKLVIDLQQRLTNLAGKNIIVLDCWRSLKSESFSSGIIYIPRGRSLHTS